MGWCYKLNTKKLHGGNFEICGYVFDGESIFWETVNKEWNKIIK